MSASYKIFYTSENKRERFENINKGICGNPNNWESACCNYKIFGGQSCSTDIDILYDSPDSKDTCKSNTDGN